MGAHQPGGEHKGRRPARRISVVAYLATAFGVSLATLVGLTVMTTVSSFDRERERAESELRAVAERVAGWMDPTESVQEFLDQMTSQPAMIALDPAGCQGVFDGLRGLIDAHVHLVRTDGTEVCGLSDERAPGATIAAGPWLTKVLASDDVVLEAPAVDPFAHTPAQLSAKRVMGPDGPVGAVAAVLYTGVPPYLDEGEHFPAEYRLVTVDASRSLVLSTTENTARFLGKRIKDGRPDLSGDQVWIEAKVPNVGWYVEAAVPTSVALAPARAELRRLLMVGGASVLVVLLLGVLLHRRLARPVRRLGRALEASRAGDDSARATVEGPTEVAHAAEVFNDLITERQAREAELAWQASHDTLTGLPNRLAVTTHLDAVLADGGHVGVLFLDLDRFKLVNDSHGHAVGDEVLVALGARLTEVLDGAGLVGRFGGDEFVAVCPNLVGEVEAVAVAARLAETLRSPLRVAAQEIWLAGSIGIALPHDGDGAEDLLRNADTAMYRAKENGRGGYALFDKSMREWAILRLDIERDLHRALERGELSLHYQPKVALAQETAVGVEALLRWTHPDRGMVPPGDFIPVAEETGLIIPIGAWVLQQAAAQARAWRCAEGGRPLPVAVNLSARQLATPDLALEVGRLLETVAALPTDVIVELTESAVLQDPEGASQRLAALREMGVKVSIDDFGTGYSSLSYLQRLPIDELKIDRSFIQRLGDRSTGAIVGSIVDLAHAIGLTVVAEGIETDEQLVALRDLDCDMGQGFLLARPQPVDQVTALLSLPSLARLTTG